MKDAPRTRRPLAHRRVAVPGSSAILCLAAFAVACTQTARHDLLTTFFDGVPPLNGSGAGPAIAPEAGGGATAGPIDPALIGAELEPPGLPSQYLHEPYRARQCTACHDLSNVKSVKVGRQNVCITCHGAVTADLEFVHGPVAAGDCLRCHAPHKSELPHLLLAPPGETCVQCHDWADLKSGEHHAGIGTEGSAACVQCHRPHGGRDRFFSR